MRLRLLHYYKCWPPLSHFLISSYYFCFYSYWVCYRFIVLFDWMVLLHSNHGLVYIRLRCISINVNVPCFIHVELLTFVLFDFTVCLQIGVTFRFQQKHAAWIETHKATPHRVYVVRAFSGSTTKKMEFFCFVQELLTKWKCVVDKAG